MSRGQYEIVTSVIEAKQQTKPTLKPDNRTLYEFAISTAVGLLSGVLAAGAAIRKEFNDEVKNWPGMAGENGLIKKYEKLFNKCDLDYAHKPENWKQHALEKRDLKIQYDKEFVTKFLKERHGIESEGFFKGGVYGTYQRSMHLGTSNKKLDVWFKGLSVAAIVGVGFYNLVTSIATRKKARQIEDLILDKANEPVHMTVVNSENGQPTHLVTQVEGHERAAHADKQKPVVGRH